MYIIYTHYIYIYIYHVLACLPQHICPGSSRSNVQRSASLRQNGSWPVGPQPGRGVSQRGASFLVLLIIVYHFVSLVVICSVSMQFITNIGSTIYAAGSQVAVCPSFMNVTGCNCIDQKIVSVHSVKLYLSFLDQGRLIKHRRAPYK